jgi:hypothetical protein
MVVTGTTNNSRLSELKKYAIGVSFNQQYVGGGNWTIDGVDYPNSNSEVTMTYYLGGIKFIDDINNNVTNFSFTTLGTGDTNNFIDEPYLKNFNKDKIISNPKINDDVFIIRDNLSAFDKNYRLEYVNNLVDLITYAGGKYFNIVNNT